MSLILPSTVAPAASANPSIKTAARSDEQDQNNPVSFGETLARSLEPAGEKAEKPATKSAAPTPARRQAGNQKTDSQDLVNLMAVSLVPFESRVAKTGLPGNAGTSADSAVTGSAVTGSDAASLNNFLAETPVPAGEPTDAPQVTTGTDVQATLVSVLTAASQKSAGQTPLQAKVDPVNDGAVIEVDARAIAGQAKATSTVLSDQTSKRGDKDANTLSESNDERAGLALVSPQGASSPVAPDALASTSVALPVNFASAVVQTSSGVFASSAPTPIATAPLTPEVGSSDWGNALGQHVIRMGHADHQVAELQLNPPGLGSLKVTLSMNDHQMQAMFVSAHSSVRAAVEAALPQLRALLADSGISLGNTSVGAESQSQTAFANGQNSQPQRGTYQPTEMTDTATHLPARPVTEQTRRNNSMRIDTYA